MLRGIVETILRESSENGGAKAQREICRDELVALFHDEFAAHAMLVRSRKAARAAQMQMAA